MTRLATVPTTGEPFMLFHLRYLAVLSLGWNFVTISLHADCLQPVATLPGHGDPITSLRFVEDDRLLLSSDRALGLALWDVRSGRAVMERDGRSAAAHDVTTVWVSSTQLAVIATSRGLVQAVNSTGQEIYSREFARSRLDPVFTSIALSPDERYLALANTTDQTLLLIATESGRTVWQSELKNYGTRTSLSFDPTGERMLALAGDHIEVYEATGGEYITSLSLSGYPWREGSRREVFGVGGAWFAGFGRFAVLDVFVGPQMVESGRTYSSDGRGIALLDLTTRKILYRDDIKHAILIARISQDNAQLMTLNAAGILLLHDVTTGQVVWNCDMRAWLRNIGGYEPGSEYGPAFAFSEDLTMLATPGEWDRSIQIFRIQK